MPHKRSTKTPLSQIDMTRLIDEHYPWSYPLIHYKRIGPLDPDQWCPTLLLSMTLAVMSNIVWHIFLADKQHEEHPLCVTASTLCAEVPNNPQTEWIDKCHTFSKNVKLFNEDWGQIQVEWNKFNYDHSRMVKKHRHAVARDGLSVNLLWTSFVGTSL